ncbi:hypothetical protein [Coxiella burnetii]|nr:hypothetical protein [Coxiella burnetii]PHH57045.1 hypothetical protein CRH12_07510 [Coxiella burnetii]UYK70163.1 hypothetical protein OHM78_02555 [Coxiella burnetii]
MRCMKQGRFVTERKQSPKEKKELGRLQEEESLVLYS